jgi:hypothetical protein
MTDIPFDPAQSPPRTGYGDRFYLAATFSNMEQAGRAYTPIQELLRRNTDTDLSVFRVQLSGRPFVVVLGVQPPAPILDRIKNALALGTMAPLPAAAVDWLLERREQRPVQTGFSERHYTPDAGPGYSRRRRAQRLPVTWHNQLPTREQAAGSITNLQTGEIISIPPQFVGVCDWCTSELTLPLAAIHHFAVQLTFPDCFQTITGGRWATCSMCQDRLHLKVGDTQVRFGSVDNLWLAHGSRYLRGHFGEAAARGIRVRTFYSEEPE